MLKIEIHTTKDFTKNERLKFIEAMRIGEVVFNSQEFYNEIMRSRFTFKKGRKDSNQVIYNRFMSGANLFLKNRDSDIDVYAGMFYANTYTVARTWTGSVRIEFNRKYFVKNDEPKIIGSTAHEEGHNLGYDHISYKERTSVPYMLGIITERVARKLQKDGKLIIKHYNIKPRKRWWKPWTWWR